MDELIAKICAESGLSADAARGGVVAILSFVRREGPPGDVDRLFAAVPGAAEAAPAGAGSSGGFFGGGLLAVAGQLAGLGLGLDQMKSLGASLSAFLNEKAGPDLVSKVTSGIPGLSQFL